METISITQKSGINVCVQLADIPRVTQWTTIEFSLQYISSVMPIIRPIKEHRKQCYKSVYCLCGEPLKTSLPELTYDIHGVKQCIDGNVVEEASFINANINHWKDCSKWLLLEDELFSNGFVINENPYLHRIYSIRHIFPTDDKALISKAKTLRGKCMKLNMV